MAIKADSKVASTNSLKADTIAAIAASIIAFLAICISLWDHYETREFNRMSVKPYLAGFGNMTTEDGKRGVGIRNDGLGPARILSAQLFDDSGNSLPQSGSQAVQQIMHTHPEIKAGGMTYCKIFEKGVMIRSGELVYLIWIIPSETNSPDLREFQAALSHINFKFQYESLYQERGDLTISGAEFLKQ
jgi:hypothetical protein